MFVFHTFFNDISISFHKRRLFRYKWKCYFCQVKVCFYNCFPEFYRSRIWVFDEIKKNIIALLCLLMPIKQSFLANTLKIFKVFSTLHYLIIISARLQIVLVLFCQRFPCIFPENCSKILWPLFLDRFACSKNKQINHFTLDRAAMFPQNRNVLWTRTSTHNFLQVTMPPRAFFQLFSLQRFISSKKKVYLYDNGHNGNYDDIYSLLL